MTQCVKLFQSQTRYLHTLITIQVVLVVKSGTLCAITVTYISVKRATFTLLLLCWQRWQQEMATCAVTAAYFKVKSATTFILLLLCNK